MPGAMSLKLIRLLVVLADPAEAQDWGERDRKVVAEALRSWIIDADILNQNARCLRRRSEGRTTHSSTTASPCGYRPFRQRKPFARLVWQKCCFGIVALRTGPHRAPLARRQIRFRCPVTSHPSLLAADRMPVPACRALRQVPGSAQGLLLCPHHPVGAVSGEVCQRRLSGGCVGRP